MKLLKILLLICGFIVGDIGLMLLSARLLLFPSMLLTILLLLILTIKSNNNINKLVYISIVIHLIIFIVPLDIRINTGYKKGIIFAKALYGLPTQEGLDAMEKGEYIGMGCVMPLWPAKYILNINY